MSKSNAQRDPRPTAYKKVIGYYIGKISIRYILMTFPYPVDIRLAQLSDWLAALPAHYQLDLASLEPASADAGARRYFRLASRGPQGPTMIAVDALIRWQCATHAEVLPIYDETFVRRELELFPTWYLERHLGITVDCRARSTGSSFYYVG